MVEKVSARYQVKDSEGNVQVDEEGKALYNECTVEYDFPGTLEEMEEAWGREIVHSQAKSAAKIALQNIMRAKLKAGSSPDSIQDIANGWKPGMVMERTATDPITAITSAFSTWSDEKKAEFLSKLGVEV